MLDLFGVRGAECSQGRVWNWGDPPWPRLRDREKAVAISRKTKGRGAKRESDQAIVLEGEDNTTSPSLKKKRGKGL